MSSSRPALPSAAPTGVRIARRQCSVLSRNVARMIDVACASPTCLLSLVPFKVFGRRAGAAAPCGHCDLQRADASRGLSCGETRSRLGVGRSNARAHTSERAPPGRPLDELRRESSASRGVSPARAERGPARPHRPEYGSSVVARNTERLHGRCARAQLDAAALSSRRGH